VPASLYRKKRREEFHQTIMELAGFPASIAEAKSILGEDECKKISQALRAKYMRLEVSSRTFTHSDPTYREAFILMDSSSLADIKIPSALPMAERITSPSRSCGEQED
jgi:hypothetical protein